MELTETNELFNLWKDTHLQNIIPENVKKHFIMILRLDHLNI
jgi:hypothetical protein